MENASNLSKTLQNAEAVKTGGGGRWGLAQKAHIVFVLF